MPTALAALLLLAATAAVTAWAAQRVVTVVDQAAGIELSFSRQSKLCDPGVEQISGLMRLGSSQKQLFFWYFDSRRNPAKDPLVVWLSGGPGCSSMLGLLAENGPCVLNANQTTRVNANGWNSRASVIWVDQPVGTGFSEGRPLVSDEAQVAKDMDVFLRVFVATFNKTHLPLFLTGESYAGHYLPAISKLVYLNNIAGVTPRLNLSGVAIGNGWVNPLLQYSAYPKMALTFNTSSSAVKLPLISEARYAKMTKAIPKCKQLIKTCTSQKRKCISAINFCESQLFNPVANLGYNYYDLRGQCTVPGCYDFSAENAYLNNPSVRLELGVSVSDHNWTSCSNPVYYHFTALDWMSNFAPSLQILLDNGIPVLSYNGDCDYICNWIGNVAWLNALAWSGQVGFNAAPEVVWKNGLGTSRTFKGLTFLRIHNAGHLVPHDQPVAALEMLNDFISGTG